MKKDLAEKFLYSQRDKSDLEIFNIKGKVKEIIQKKFISMPPANAYSEGVLFSEEHTMFNEDGNVISQEYIDYIDPSEEKSVDSSNLIRSISKDVYLYINGLCVEAQYDYKDFGKNRKFTLNHVENYTYDEKGNLIKIGRRELKYNEHNKLAEFNGAKYRYSANKIKEKASIYIKLIILDDERRVIEEKFYVLSGKFFLKKKISNFYRYKYNDNGDLISVINLIAPKNVGLVKEYTQFKYDKMNNWVYK